jgi:hypothetical protein
VYEKVADCELPQRSTAVFVTVCVPADDVEIDSFLADGSLARPLLSSAAVTVIEAVSPLA